MTDSLNTRDADFTQFSAVPVNLPERLRSTLDCVLCAQVILDARSTPCCSKTACGICLVNCRKKCPFCRASWSSSPQEAAQLQAVVECLLGKEEIERQRALREEEAQKVAQITQKTKRYLSSDRYKVLRTELRDQIKTLSASSNWPFCYQDNVFTRLSALCVSWGWCPLSRQEFMFLLSRAKYCSAYSSIIVCFWKAVNLPTGDRWESEQRRQTLIKRWAHMHNLYQCRKHSRRTQRECYLRAFQAPKALFEWVNDRKLQRCPKSSCHTFVADLDDAALQGESESTDGSEDSSESESSSDNSESEENDSSECPDSGIDEGFESSEDSDGSSSSDSESSN